ncbi:hypothetical protein [Vibrio parahaemolyticus]|uniref:hypothetical protein n=1 Tax=Vibrio parahaemolyticus TaxID=670 RepID=UPI0008135139|nr:hypothetical protein [Vibrio parahaemolyticus]OCP68377.1 hypothetical protein AKH08_16330 [Vibrio parahaemolyticus]
MTREIKSITESLDLPEVDIRDVKDISTDDKPPLCKTCRGTGKNKHAVGNGVLCMDCRGVGYDLQDSVHVILWMSQCLQFAKKKIINQRLEIDRLKSSEDDVQQRFYEGGQLKD